MSYIPVVRDQPFLMPPDIREWLPGDHLAWFVLDAVAALDTSGFHENRQLGGVGRRGYDPDMLLALLVYCYANGERSSRRVERLCELDVACRVICSNLKPDHTVIARFRSENEEAFRAFFAQVVALCVAEGMGGLGVVAIDGTKIEADASRLSNRTRKAITSEVNRIVDEAVATDAEEGELFGEARGGELPQEWADPEGRVERLRRALDQLDSEVGEALEESGTGERVEKAEKHLETVRSVQQSKVDRYVEAVAEGRKPKGRPPVGADDYSVTILARRRLEAARAAHAEAIERAERNKRGHLRRVNITDPDSRLMLSKGAWVQGYNAQAVLNENGIAVAAAVSNQVSDVASLHPLITQAQQLAGGATNKIGVVVADAGFWSENNIIFYDPEDPETPQLLIPPQDFDSRNGEAQGPPPSEDASPAEKMRYRLTTPEGKKLYQMRATQAEAPFGHLKTRFRFTRFSRRGLTAVDSEWHLILTVRNLVKLHQASAPATA